MYRTHKHTTPRGQGYSQRHLSRLLQVETVKKSTAATNKTSAGKDAAKLDRETEELHHDRVPTELKRRIQQARLDKKLTQAQLGNMINEKPQVIQEYESGKAIPNPQVLGKLSRALGVQLSAKKK